MAPEVGRPRPPPRLPLDQVRAGARGSGARGGPAPPRPPGGVPGRARRGAARRSGRSTTATGLGPDQTVWGGEILAGGLEGYERRGLLFPVRMPGGDRATLEPWRMACAWLVAATGSDAPAMPEALAGEVDPDSWEAVCGLIAAGLNSPPTTSAGRLFDAVAALCGIRAAVNYEGQAAAELEGLADVARDGRVPDAADRRRGWARRGRGDPRRARDGGCRDERSAGRGTQGDGCGAFSQCARRAPPPPHSRASARPPGSTWRSCQAACFQNRLLLERTVALLREGSTAGADPAAAAAQRRRHLLRPGGDRRRPRDAVT